jgi:hypothetical protein
METMKLRVEHSGLCKTYTVLCHTAQHLLDHAKHYESGSLLQIKASVVFSAFTFEAYLNHVGSEEIPFWNEIERIPYKKKLRVIAAQLGLTLDTSRPLLHTVFELFRLRDILAHGRTTEFSEPYETDAEPAFDSAWNILPWEKLTMEDGECYLAAVTQAIELINKSRSVHDEFLWNQGTRSKSVSIA